ncbi:hypothetical protein [Phenylobacterium aquaticum]|uniref:hypothetical protein n=1 Tax=Phenylobacterium aquaticum TaxID=1763816 RepID=UPI001F5E28C0|nr:hypothetical protein [Phenylobacterium aquaticum]MCI3133138.1 hypothetical protein [Phenylobacterium aquaticum]
MFNVFGRRAGVVRATAGYLSLIGGGELLTLSQFGYDNGLGVLWFLGGIVAGFVVLAFVGDRIRSRAGAIGANTFTGLVRAEYGLTAASGLGSVYLIALGSLLTIQFIVGGDLLSTVTGLNPSITSIMMGAVIVSYLLAAGYVAVLSTDVLRAIMLSVVLFVALLSFQVHGLRVDRLAGAEYGALPISDGMTLLVLGVFGVICAADVWQTAIASRSKVVLQRSMFGAAAVFLVVGSLIGLLGALTRQLVPHLGTGVSALVAASTHAVSPEFAPLMALMIIGAVMATGDTEIWVISTTLLGLRKGSPSLGEQDENFQKDAKRQTRIMIPIVTIVAVTLAFITRNAQGLYESLLILLTAVAPGVLAIVFGISNKLAVSASIWAGILSFIMLAIAFRLSIPLSYAFLPVIGSAVLLGIGLLSSAVRQKSKTTRAK